MEFIIKYIVNVGDERLAPASPKINTINKIIKVLYSIKKTVRKNSRLQIYKTISLFFYPEDLEYSF